MGALNLPNSLTILRIIAIPFFAAALVYGRFTAALIVFIAASITDALDGIIARRMHTQTALGKFLDPIGDKFLLVISYILFSYYGLIPTWLTITIITRDLIVIIGCLVLYMIYSVLFIKPSILGKTAIAFQMTLAAYILLGINYDGSLPSPDILIWITATLTAGSGLHYIYKGFSLSAQDIEKP
ncbi:CDP-diacylglycerol--glycerol-3-phosphate 3-phosphatidyltransferase [Candidatus Magnetoovum chiemensis]|nr:CDP-diacylglycerol--glycerol-3-phosphate 3-phosphatidyltransferase [Candidatus Magnetoovum chiemensis]